MTKILGIDTSNYTSSVAIVEDGKCIYDLRTLLDTKIGERGLRQSEALFQHIKNLPRLLETELLKGVDGISVSVKPRPLSESYMPVFIAGESIAKSIALSTGIKVFATTHQEGHIEAAINSLDFDFNDFICIHLSGGTTEVLKVSRNKEYSIDIIGKTKDISAGQFIDRIGVAMGMSFPSGKTIDELAISIESSSIRIPSRVEGFDMNFSGQETQCLKYIKEGYNENEIAFATLLCVAKTLEKVINNLSKSYRLPILITGGVASSSFIKKYLHNKVRLKLFFSDKIYASDNAVGVALIGYNKFLEGYYGTNN